MMSWKIYLITHLDTGMKYVGYTEVDLKKCWDTHHVNPKYAVHKAIQTDGHRMTMTLLEEVETRAIARDLKQKYIQSFNSAEPNGWNRQIIKPKDEPVTTPKKWTQVQGGLVTKSEARDALACPSCEDTYTHQSTIEVFSRQEDCDGIHACVLGETVITDRNMSKNPSPRRQGLRIYFTCESCHCEDGDNCPPPYELLIYQHKGQTFFETVYYTEHKS
jgi:hypothetical protein